MHFYMLHLIYVFKLTKKILQVLFMLWLSICITITCITRILKSFLADWFSLIFDLNGFKGDQRPKLHPCFYGIFLLVSWREREREPSSKFCDILISFHEVMGLQSFGFDVINIILANVHNITLLAFFTYFCLFYEERTFYKALCF